MKSYEVNKRDRRKCKYCTRLGKTIRISIAVINVIQMDVVCLLFSLRYNPSWMYFSQPGSGL
jgi:hypothetical protein